MRQHGKIVPGFVFDPLRKHFHVIAELRNEPGSLADVASSLAKAGANILSGMTFAGGEGGLGLWSFFVRPARGMSSRRLKELVDSSPRVAESTVEESSDGFLLDDAQFPVLLGDTGMRVVLVRQKPLSAMCHKVRETFGTGGDSIIYEQGVVFGRDVVEEYTPLVGAEFMAKHLDRFLRMYTALGWGRVASVSAAPGLSKVSVRMTESFECAGRKSEGPYSQFIRGHLCGVVSGIAGKEMGCEEVRCIAKGDPACEFVLTRT